MNYIWHWSDESLHKKYVPGSIIQKWKDWVSKNYSYKSIYNVEKLKVQNWEYFDGEPEECKNLLRYADLFIKYY